MTCQCGPTCTHAHTHRRVAPVLLVESGLGSGFH
uniref:Uncharacterized protein n=1 Tax=Anguilla anguilla TaxID=7936 RepID=A0A0E9UVQ2_ANGAN